jgi:CubicO group peptidase (beta-lactamase class C family)
MVNVPFSVDRRRVLTGLGALFLTPACVSGGEGPEPKSANAGSHGGSLEAAKPETVGMSSSRIAEVLGRIDARVNAGRFPGATAIIGRRGKIVGEHAVGMRVRGGNDAMTMDTMFDMMSVTKVMSTAISAMVLVDQGKLKLDDPVVKHLPAFTGKDKVTVKHMLSYSSGLPLDNNIFSGRPEEIWQQMAATKLGYEPGTQVEYSDLTYRLLGKLIENVAGKPLDAVARENVWVPLGMNDTMYAPHPQSDRHARVAATGPTERRKHMVRGVVQDDQDFTLGGVVGCDGLFSTAKDAAVFCQMMMNGGTYGGKRIISSELAAAMVSNQTPFVDVAKTDTSQLMNLLATPKGYGWELATPRFSNGGTRLSPGSYGKAGGTGTFMWIDPVRQVFAVLLTNHGLPVPFDEPGWNRLLDDVGCGEFFDGVISAVVS